MKEINFFRTYSLGGMEGRTKVVRNFETSELAKENAINDNWNDNFELYEVKLTFNGIIIETETFIEKILCGRDLAIKKNQEVTNNNLVRKKIKK